MDITFDLYRENSIKSYERYRHSKDSATAVSIHSLVDHKNADVVDILPPVHPLTGYDTNSKVGTKPVTLKTANECCYELLVFFWEDWTN